MTEDLIVNGCSVFEQWGQVCEQLKSEIGETALIVG